ncbi:hypothetical protein GUJ93_ZPchr0006g43512 [Zizania palustris]|uniref:Uncharacterized protein n=1 Tax=Zizania palustris TaxID=103762 RepID=A0A8J5SZU5_ZIZPA|nr:hypothetical protein GUJ93_ZPchr0006g43512 [Zizania palustris]
MEATGPPPRVPKASGPPPRVPRALGPPPQGAAPLAAARRARADGAPLAAVLRHAAGSLRPPLGEPPHALAAEPRRAPRAAPSAAVPPPSAARPRAPRAAAPQRPGGGERRGGEEALGLGFGQEGHHMKDCVEFLKWMHKHGIRYDENFGKKRKNN